MSQESIVLPYTICFCISQDKVLLIYRYWPPHQYLWNGVGGKIEENETPNQAVRREVREEGALDLDKASATRFAGIVTWSGLKNNPNNNKGMYAFVADFSRIETEWDQREIDEGKLEWKDLEWVLDTSNNAIAENVAHFLPRMLGDGELREYHCLYDEGKLKEMIVRPLPSLISL